MKLIEDFRDKKVVNNILKLIDKENNLSKNYRIMEICGTHTMSIARFGIRNILPSNIKLVSGPGCPVCVTSQGELDTIFTLLKANDVILATFGDLMNVPGSDKKSLIDYRAEGHDIRVVTSPLDCIKIASISQKEVVFIGIGFETTAPTIAAMVKIANEKGIRNLSIISFFKTMPDVIELLLTDNNLNIDGFLCPGHVSVITGNSIYYPIVKSGRSAIITGFEPVDILYSIYKIMCQINSNMYCIENLYSRIVNNAGNPVAIKILYDIFKVCNADWRGIGIIENSGLKFREEYISFDALKKFDISMNEVKLITECKCGEVLKGKILPSDCELFNSICSPTNPFGPCMVSSEGACAAYYKYG